MTAKEDMPAGPVDALFALHAQAMQIFRELLKGGEASWGESMALDLPFLSPETRTFSRRKIAGHALLHGHRHWAQLATLLRTAGFPSGFGGDLLFSRSID